MLLFLVSVFLFLCLRTSFISYQHVILFLMPVYYDRVKGAFKTRISSIFMHYLRIKCPKLVLRGGLAGDRTQPSARGARPHHEPEVQA